MDSRDAGGGEIKRHPVGFPVRQRQPNAFAGGHGTFHSMLTGRRFQKKRGGWVGSGDAGRTVDREERVEGLRICGQEAIEEVE